MACSPIKTTMAETMGETIEDVLRGMIAKQAHLDLSVITPELVLSELGVTSLDLVEIIA